MVGEDHEAVSTDGSTKVNKFSNLSETAKSSYTKSRSFVSIFLFLTINSFSYVCCFNKAFKTLLFKHFIAECS